MSFGRWTSRVTLRCMKGRCHPLTALDDHSRYNLVLSACGNEKGKTVRRELERAFRCYGLPLAMLMENGPPWGDPSGDPYTEFSIWLMRLGIRVLHGRPRHPQTQGKDERFHRSFKAEVMNGHSFRDLAECQQACEGRALSLGEPQASLEKEGEGYLRRGLIRDIAGAGSAGKGTPPSRWWTRGRGPASSAVCQRRGYPSPFRPRRLARFAPCDAKSESPPPQGGRGRIIPAAHRPTLKGGIGAGYCCGADEQCLISSTAENQHCPSRAGADRRQWRGPRSFRQGRVVVGGRAAAGRRRSSFGEGLILCPAWPALAALRHRRDAVASHGV